jgi:hypothetical protein
MDDERPVEQPSKPRAGGKRPPLRQPDVSSSFSRQDIGQVSDAQVDAEWTAFHLRKRGLDPTIVNEAELEQKRSRREDD